MMRIAYMECFAGISGDMFLGALVDCGVPVSVLQEAVRALDLGATLTVETVDRSGISATKVHVTEGARLSEAGGGEDLVAQQQARGQHTHQPKTRHLHKTGQPHPHEAAAPSGADGSERPHTHGRSLSAIRSLIHAAPLDGAVKRTAVRAFDLLGESEARIHNVDVEQIHFHEVGAVDAIVDIVAASAAVHSLQIDAWYCSALNVGGGTAACAHGTYPVPAPATADLLRGCPTYSAHVEMELVTPTGAAMVRALGPSFGPRPALRVERIGYGAGTRNPEGFPNVLRLSVGSAEENAPGPSAGDETETVTVLETALDDLSPQVTAWAAERALAQGALDVMLTPVTMKKGRPGTLLTVLCRPAERSAMEQLLLRETGTLGVRAREDRRVVLERQQVAVSTQYGEVRVKVGSLRGEVLNAAPEFEDCRASALRHNVPLKQVQQSAMDAYHRADGAARKMREDSGGTSR